ncbi:MAG: ROK family protein [Phycisphaerales bacterium]|nr:ROK family protein [Phycisphaerales bacterium]MCI0629473.1 ROK family protein [Phycisphaerales bacterium]MCI0674757.1 ROK family protein [Phycisphaerales bacterium]
MRSALRGLVVGIDLGGTNMQIGVVDSRNRIVGRHGDKTRASEGVEAVIDRIVGGIHISCEQAGINLKQVTAIGIAAPGAIDIAKGVVLEAPNLKWRNVPLRAILRQRLTCKIVVDNDANAAVWAESQLGVARGRGDVLGVWVGTGVGGGLVLNGRLYHGDFFTAGEIGHSIVFPDRPRGRRTVEEYCSRTGMTRTIRELLPSHPESMLNQLARPIAKGIGSRDLAESCRNRDRLALLVVNSAADLLGIAIANWITILALGSVVIGGGVAEDLGKPYLRRVTDSFKRHVFPQRNGRCRLLLTTLREDAGLLGAAMLARGSAGRL